MSSLNGNPEVKGSRSPRIRSSSCPGNACRQTPGRHAAAPAKTRAKEVRRLGAKRKAPAHYRHDFPRRAPVAHGHARPAHSICSPPPAPSRIALPHLSVSRRGVVRLLIPRCASCTMIPGNDCASCASAFQHLFPNAPPRRQRRRYASYPDDASISASISERLLSRMSRCSKCGLANGAGFECASIETRIFSMELSESKSGKCRCPGRRFANKSMMTLSG